MGQTAQPTQRSRTTVRRVAIVVTVLLVALIIPLLPAVTTAMTSIAGPLANAPFEVPGTLATDATSDGCLEVVDGRGGGATHCVPLVGDGYVGSFWNDHGELIVGTGGFDSFVRLDPGTGEVIGDSPRGRNSRADDSGPLEFPLSDEAMAEGYITTDGSRVVRRFDNGPTLYPMEERVSLRADVVLLDVGGPPWFQLQHAALSSDGDWLLTTTNYGHVLIAPTDGTHPPRVWTNLFPQWEWRWLDLHGAVRWE